MCFLREGVCLKEKITFTEDKQRSRYTHYVTYLGPWLPHRDRCFKHAKGSVWGHLSSGPWITSGDPYPHLSPQSSQTLCSHSYPPITHLILLSNSTLPSVFTGEEVFKTTILAFVQRLSWLNCTYWTWQLLDCAQGRVKYTYWLADGQVRQTHRITQAELAYHLGVRRLYLSDQKNIRLINGVCLLPGTFSNLQKSLGGGSSLGINWDKYGKSSRL